MYYRDVFICSFYEIWADQYNKKITYYNSYVANLSSIDTAREKSSQQACIIRKANKGDRMGHISITFNAREKVPFFGFEIWWQIYNSDFVTTYCDHVYFRNYCKQFYKAIKQNLCPMPWQFNAPHNKKTRRKGSIKICSCCMIKIIYGFLIYLYALVVWNVVGNAAGNVL